MLAAEDRVRMRGAFGVAQTFSRNADLLLRTVMIVLVIGLFAATAYAVMRPTAPDWQRAEPQPVPFSHKHHVGALGIECSHCHTSVEKSSSAGLPDTSTCMSCHSQLWTNAEMLEPVRESERTGEPLRWTRVHDMPDFVYFNHSIHVAKGVGCESCHGRVDRMPLMRQAKPLSMEFCLDCHRNPEQHLRPKDEVFTMDWSPPAGTDREAYGERLAHQHRLRKAGLTDCTICHR